MNERPDPQAPVSPAHDGAPPRRHLAAYIEDRVIAALGTLLRRAGGWLPRIEPYTCFGTPRRVRVLGRVLLSPRRLAPGAPRPVQRGFRSFLAIPAPGHRVVVTVGDTVVETVSDRAGYVDVEVDLPPGSPLRPGWQSATLRTTSEHPAQMRAGLLVIGDDVRLGVVSDIDDTAMVTAVPQLLVAAWNMLWVRTAARRAVRGMPELYARIVAANADTPFIYLSSGAWNTAQILRRFLARHGFPPGPLLLTDFGPTDTGWFRSGRVHKTTSLERLVKTFPQVSWVLIGDDGQADPEIYAAMARAHPDRIRAIGIRSLSRTERVIATAGAAKDDAGGVRGANATAPAQGPETGGVRIIVADDADALAAGLATVPGLLGPAERSG